MSKREEFLHSFIKALGSDCVQITNEQEDKICARVYWDDKDDYTDVEWTISEASVPSNECLNIVKHLASKDLVDLDQIKIDKNELYEQIKEVKGFSNYNDFLRAYEELLDVTIPYCDEDDAFWIHE